MHNTWKRVALAAALTFLFGAPALSQQDATQLEAVRPADVVTWPTLGMTVRLDAAGQTPRQMRHVQMAPDDFAAFVRTHVYPDGATFAVTFNGVALDRSHTPNLYHATGEHAFALEIIDRAHPDGRRFYVFQPGQTRAAPFPPGNECAVCHAAEGSFDGTFAHMYPALTPHLPAQPLSPAH